MMSQSCAIASERHKNQIWFSGNAEVKLTAWPNPIPTENIGLLYRWPPISLRKLGENLELTYFTLQIQCFWLIFMYVEATKSQFFKLYQFQAL